MASRTENLSGRTIVVTGAAGALGGAVVETLGDAGAEVSAPPDPSVGGPDLADEQAVEAWYGGQSGLWASIHVAGGFAMAPVTDIRGADLDSQWNINARTAFLCSREAVRHMRATGQGGRIVNVAARPALEGRLGAGMTAYAMSKAAVAVFTEALGEELAGEGILVNAVAPSILDTPANRRAMPDADRSGWTSVEDVARAIRFLASPANRVVRGAVIPVYGGLCPRE